MTTVSYVDQQDRVTLPDEPLWRRVAFYRLMLGAAVLFGLLVRLSFLLGSDFPLNDGGLFYAMVRDLQRSHYSLPFYTSYNLGKIPFAYPPLALYLAGLLADFTHWDLLALFRFLPLVGSVLTIFAFVPLSRSMLPSKPASAAAVFAFALLPMSFQWLIMGGGLTRSLGLLFALVALHQTYLLYSRRTASHILPATLGAAGAVLSHPEAAWFTAYSIALLFLFHGRHRQGLVHSVLVAAGTVVLTAPWWGVVTVRHGPVLLRSFGDSGFPIYDGLLQLGLLTLTHEPAFPLLGTLALLGAIVCVVRRRWFLPAWVLTICLLQARAADQKAVVPLALLAGIGVAEVLLPLLVRGACVVQDPWNRTSGQLIARPLLRVRLATTLLIALLLYSILAAMGGYRSSLTGLPKEERIVMKWVAISTPAASRVLVLTPADWWGTDAVAEWFPVLANRESVTTVQGNEWLGGFSQRITRYSMVQRCVTRGGNCLESWSRQTNISFDYIYLVKEPVGLSGDYAWTLRHLLGADPRFVQVYDGPGGTIYQWAILAPPINPHSNLSL